MRPKSHVTEETRRKMSVAKTGHPYWGPEHRSEETRAKDSAAAIGRIMSLETRTKLSAANLGKIVSPETRAKLSVVNMGNKYSLGHITSPETRAKLSATMMGPLHWRWKGGKQVSGPKHVAKRRALGFVLLNSWFPGCEGHHLDMERVVFIPRELHRSIAHNIWTGRNMAEINAAVGNWLTEDRTQEETWTDKTTNQSDTRNCPDSRDFNSA